MKNRRRLLWIIPIIPIIAIFGFTVWAYTPPNPTAEAINALEGNETVSVTQGAFIEFLPSITAQVAQGEPSMGVIFYPGGRVDARAYAPLMEAIAAAGYPAFIVPMPFNLAVFGSNKADDVIAAHPEITRWVIGGHSLGGAMAARYVDDHPEQVEGLYLLAAYPDVSDDLSDTSIAVASISATLDGLATQAKIDDTRALLPPGTQFVIIDGGNHAQFGWYGAQSGDNPATIDTSAQQAQTRDAILGLLTDIQPNPS